MFQHSLSIQYILRDLGKVENLKEDWIDKECWNIVDKTRY